MKDRLARVLARFLPRLVPNLVRARHMEPSMLFSVEDDLSQPSEFLISLSLQAIRNAIRVRLDDLDARWDEVTSRGVSEPYLRPSRWPGEHYRLLAGLTQALKPKLIVEIGTGGGLSTLAMKQHLDKGSKIVTFDIIDWRAGRPFNVLQTRDFEGGALVQYLDDLSVPATFAKHSELLRHANLVFLDGPKDGSMERLFLDNLRTLSFDSKPVVLALDDIRLWNMLGIWRSISAPKLDLTSFGHYCGTGLVEWR